MRPPRLKLRMLLLLVALATLVVVGVAYRWRASRYRALAEKEITLQRAEIAFAAFARKRLVSRSAHLRARRLQLDARLHVNRYEISEARSADAGRLADASEQRTSAQIREVEIEERTEITRLRSELERRERRADRHRRRRDAYLRCARYPWLSPPADEPMPRH